tara:strand:- start:215 stop:478 length:264 start_codon:yes stop_codon:yes gene_type:complete
MSKKNKESKKFKYLVTMRWYIETDEKLVAGASETDKKLLSLVQRKKDGRPTSENCPTRNYEGYAILDYHYFMGDNKEVYMSSDKAVD